MSDRRCNNCLHNIRGTEYIPPCSQCRDYSLWAENPEPSKLEQLQAELDAYRWIPVEERLPDKVGYYAVTDGKEWWRELWCFVDHSGAKGWENNHEVITHWKPITLPEGE